LIERQTTDDLAAMLGRATTSSRAGDHGAAIATLSSAVALAPDDRTAHRRLAAAYAVEGDLDGARREYLRFVTRLELRGSAQTAVVERSYAAALLAPRPVAPPVAPAPGHHELTADQALALRRVAVAVIAIAATVTAMIVAGAQIFASGAPL
jgi:DNA-binding SARP family transcriptional activator